jgi:hypothetical protein
MLERETLLYIQTVLFKSAQRNTGAVAQRNTTAGYRRSSAAEYHSGSAGGSAADSLGFNESGVQAAMPQARVIIPAEPLDIPGAENFRHLDSLGSLEEQEAEFNKMMAGMLSGVPQSTTE